jgi:menaquinone-dependent protoporphyrinogen IX oxidase
MEANIPRIAVLYATSQGSTRNIAEFIGNALTARGPIDRVEGLSGMRRNCPVSTP